jgi:transposase InsO family protein
MLTETEFAAWCKRLALSQEAVELIQRIRSSPPVRRVQQNRMSVSGAYPSRKNGFKIQFESHKVEFPLVYKLEHDPDVLEYYCQPCTMPLEYVSANGRMLRHLHTPDYFAIRQESAGWVEAKSKDNLPQLAKEQPNRWRFENGLWISPPGMAYANRFGLTYQVHSSADVSATFVRNANFMDDYLRDPPPVTAEVIREVRGIVETGPILSLSELLAKTTSIASNDQIYTMIVQSELFVDWDAHPFVEPDDVRVFADAETGTNFSKARSIERPACGILRVEVGSPLAWDGRPWLVANVGDRSISLRGEGEDFTELPSKTFDELLGSGRIICKSALVTSHEHPEARARRMAAGPKEIKEANRRYKKISPYLSTGSLRPKNRTERRWVASYKQAKSTYGDGMAGLYPQTGRQGNRTRRMRDEVDAAMNEFIKTHYECKSRRKAHSSWCAFIRECEERGWKAPSFNTFLKAVRNRPRHEQKEKREGPRSAHNEKEFFFYLDQDTPPHGDRPFEIAHIDHTELDVELVCLKTGEVLGRPWLTIMTCAFSRRFVGKYLTFDPPSSRSLMMVSRDCVRRYGRIPQTFVYDGGKEFGSIYFHHLMGRYECTDKIRPTADGRFGSPCERLFGTTNTMLIHNLAGNTQITKTPRIMTKSVNPKNLAVWDLAGLDERLEEYMFHTYDVREHPALSQSPRDAFLNGLLTTGNREHRRVLYDMDFIMETFPSTRKGTVKVRPGRGVMLRSFTYWTDDFRNPLLANKNVPVRWDPYNRGIAWVFVLGRWAECRSNYFAQMNGKTEKQVQIASEIDSKRRQNSASRGRNTTPRIIADMLTNAYQEEDLRRQQLKDLESQRSRIHLVSPPAEGRCDPGPTRRPQARTVVASSPREIPFQVYESL